MAILTVEGIYKDGKVELIERPEGVGAGARVIVTFLHDTRPPLPPPAYLPTDPEELEKLRQEAFAQMERGLDLGGPPYPKREELYDRFER